MREGELARWCRRELRGLQIDPPFDLLAFSERVALRRGKSIRIAPYPLDVGVYGLWLAYSDVDMILYQAETTPEHQKHIVLHEFGHLLAGHQSDEGDPGALDYLLPNLPVGLIRSVLRRTCYDEEHEREAELVATIIAEWADRMDQVTPSRSRGHSRWLDGAMNEPVGWE